MRNVCTKERHTKKTTNTTFRSTKWRQSRLNRMCWEPGPLNMGWWWKVDKICYLRRKKQKRTNFAIIWFTNKIFLCFLLIPVLFSHFLNNEWPWYKLSVPLPGPDIIKLLKNWVSIKCHWLSSRNLWSLNGVYKDKCSFLSFFGF